MGDSPYLDDERVIEILAAIEHIRWSEWQQYCHDVLRQECPSPEMERVLARWDRQIATPYHELTEREKQSDRDQVFRYWGHIQAMIEARNV